MFLNLFKLNFVSILLSPCKFVFFSHRFVNSVLLLLVFFSYILLLLFWRKRFSQLVQRNVTHFKFFCWVIDFLVFFFIVRTCSSSRAQLLLLLRFLLSFRPLLFIAFNSFLFFFLIVILFSLLFFVWVVAAAGKHLFLCKQIKTKINYNLNLKIVAYVGYAFN